MSFILSIETATKNCSVALSNEGKTVTLKEVADQNIILDFIYQFLEQNISSLIQGILYVLIGFCIMSYLFVFTINIINKKKEIAVLKAFGASQEAIAILFMLRPIKFTISIFKDTLIYSFIHS